jgi:hypothetical protein
MSNIIGFVVVLLIYIGAIYIGLGLFGEGAYAAYFGGILGTIALIWLIKNSKND